MNQLVSEYDHHRRRLELEQEWREKQLQQIQEQRQIRRWWITAIVLLLLFGVGIAASTYFNANWGWLAAAGGIGFLVFFVLFLIFGLDTLKNSWKYQHEVAEIKNQQQLLDEIYTQGLAIQQYDEYYRRIFVPQVIEEYREQSRLNRNWHQITQLSVIITSLLVTGLTSGLDAKLGIQIPWAAPLLSFAVSLCTAVIGFYKFRERSLYMQQTADSIEQEKNALELSIGRYKEYGSKSEAAFREFAERVELLREEQQKRQQQLEQFSESKDAPAA